MTTTAVTATPRKTPSAPRVKKPRQEKKPEPVPDVDEGVLADTEHDTSKDDDQVVPSTPTEPLEPKDHILSELSSISTTLHSMAKDLKAKSETTAVSRELQRIAKRVAALKKPVEKLSKPKKIKRAPTGDTKPNGFNIKMHITKDFCTFAGWKESDKYSRTDVTRFLCNYVEQHRLQNPQNGREIVPDEKLRLILQYDGSSEPPLTYYYLQKKIKHIFIRPEDESSTPVEA